MKYLIPVIAFMIIISPAIAMAGIVPCETPDSCGFIQFLDLGTSIFNFLVTASIPVAVVAMIWAGFLILTSGGNPSRLAEGKEIMMKVLIGMFFILTAWLIVHTITSALLKERFNLLQP